MFPWHGPLSAGKLQAFHFQNKQLDLIFSGIVGKKNQDFFTVAFHMALTNLKYI